MQKAGLLKEYVPTSPELQQIEAQIAEARARIGSEAQSLVGEKADTLNPVYQKMIEQYTAAEAERVGVGAKIDGLKRALAAGQAELERLPSRALRLAELTRSAR